MPELPEVETVVRDLQKIQGRTIRAVRHGKKKLRMPWKPAWNARIAGMRIEAIRRRGKWIIVELDGPRLLVHLGMTGRFSTTAHEPAIHRHVVLELDDGTEVQFFDPRRFGSVALIEDEAALQAHFKKMKLGPEPQDVRFVAFCVAVINTSRNLKSILLDQQIVAGLGNIYVNEVCFLAGIHPTRKGPTLRESECRRLVQSIKAVIREAIKHRGTTLEDEGYLGGKFQKRLRVYDREGQGCRTCSTAIERIVISNRSTYYCPACQPATVS